MPRDSGLTVTVFAKPIAGFLFAASLAIVVVPSAAPGQDNSGKSVSAKVDLTDSPQIDEKHPLFKLLQVAYKSRKQLDSIDDYECIFAKRELVGKKILKTTMNLKFRESPQSVYLKFLDANMGREVIYFQGKNGNQLLVHEAGIKAVLGTFSISPTGSDAMAENRYPITSIGLRNMLDTVINQWEAEGKFGGTAPPQKRPDSKTPTGEVCTVYEAIHEKPFKEFKFHTTRLWIDDATGLAIGVQQCAFPGKNDKEPPILEEYFYGKLKTNLKLTDVDFDKNNPKYAFK